MLPNDPAAPEDDLIWHHLIRLSAVLEKADPLLLELLQSHESLIPEDLVNVMLTRVSEAEQIKLPRKKRRKTVLPRKKTTATIDTNSGL